MNIEENITMLKGQIRDIGKKLQFLRKLKATVGEIPGVSAASPSGYIDFDHLEHEDVIKVIRGFGGKWNKEVSSVRPGTVNYERQDTIDGLRLRCWGGKPPPSCKLVEVEEIIPAQPARVVKKLKMVCIGQGAEPVADEIQKAQNHNERTQNAAAETT